MKKEIIIAIDIVALIIAIIWGYKTNWDFEPIVVILSLVGALIGLILSKSSKSKMNKVNIKGSGNKIHQDIGKDENVKEENTLNEVKINGDSNVVFQNVKTIIFGENKRNKKAKYFLLAYHLGFLVFYSEYIKRNIASKEFTDWLNDAKNIVRNLVDVLKLNLASNNQNEWFDVISLQVTSKSIMEQKCFFIGNIIGRCQSFGINPIKAGVIPPFRDCLERLKQAEDALQVANLPSNLLIELRLNWENSISNAENGILISNDETDNATNKIIEDIVLRIEKNTESSGNRQI